MTEPDELEADTEMLTAAHNALERWFTECKREARHQYSTGRSGHIGTFKLHAYSDDGVLLELKVERSMEETL